MEGMVGLDISEGTSSMSTGAKKNCLKILTIIIEKYNLLCSKALLELTKLEGRPHCSRHLRKLPQPVEMC